MNCWWRSETEINSPRCNTRVCLFSSTAHTSIISVDCLSDGSVYASASCSAQSEMSGDLKIHEHKPPSVPGGHSGHKRRTVLGECLLTCLLEQRKDLQSYFWMRESTAKLLCGTSSIILAVMRGELMFSSSQKDLNGSDLWQSQWTIWENISSVL